MQAEVGRKYERPQVYGPVPSRRLGRSLGVDLVPPKSCPYDCVYCQVGRTTALMLEPVSFYPVEEVVAVVRERLTGIAPPDYITFSGIGEPTLNRDLGRIIDGLRAIAAIPIAVITDGALLYREDVAAGLMKADVVMPSLDAVSPEVFRRLNRPHPELVPERVIEGLRRFSRRYRGRLLLEIMLVRGMNDSDDEIAKLIEVARTVRLEVVQLNTVVRPPSETSAEPLDPVRLEAVRERFAASGLPVETITEFKDEGAGGREGDHPDAERVLDLLGRRPCTVEDVAGSLGYAKSDVESLLEKLLHLRQVCAEESGGRTYYSRK